MMRLWGFLVRVVVIGVAGAGALACIYRGITGAYAAQPGILILGCMGVAVLLEFLIWADE